MMMAAGDGKVESSVVVLVADDDLRLGFHYSASAAAAAASCRICHEEEEEEEGSRGGSSSSSCSCSRKLEAPCACSGTAKYAHRECIQRWCDIKGDTTCEICLQKFEPDYTATAPTKKERTEEEVITIRSDDDDSESSEEEEEEDDDETASTRVLLETTTTDVSECISSAERSASFCKTVAIMLTILLVARQLLAVLTEDDSSQDYYPFSLLTIIGLRTCGVVMPMYMIIHSLTALQNNIRRQRLLRLPLSVARRTARRRRRRRGGHAAAAAGRDLVHPRVVDGVIHH